MVTAWARASDRTITLLDTKVATMTAANRPHPPIVQGGMGVGVSSWQLASAVARRGQLGVVSGTAVATTVARRLMDGDPGGHVRRALTAFPSPRITQTILDRWFRPDPDPGGTYRPVPMYTLSPPRILTELTIAANFVEVHLAKHGHDGLVGVNYLEKIQLPTLPSLYGAMLADVDHVFMGAGIPARIPGLLDRLARHQPVSMPVTLIGADKDDRDAHRVHFDPAEYVDEPPPLRRPVFVAIVASTTLARHLVGKDDGAPDALVIEAPDAGGHNAPPRGRLRLDDQGQPVYGSRDEVDLDKVATLGVPFWLAGGQADPQHVQGALESGAAGVQVGTAFALCEESGIDPDLKRRVLDQVIAGEVEVHTDPLASPTGFPFKVVELVGTTGDHKTWSTRPRLCDLGYLREPYKRPDGLVGYRCAAEPVADYVRKGGDEADTHGRKCLCNGLVATVGLGQTRPGTDGYREPPLGTAGDAVVDVGRYLADGATSYTAAEVIDQLLGGVTGALSSSHPAGESAASTSRHTAGTPAALSH